MCDVATAIVAHSARQFETIAECIVGYPHFSWRSMSDTNTSAQSPCIRNCCLDDGLTCVGCFRSLEEIKEWSVVDDHRRRIILQNAKQRREAYRIAAKR
jgi:predicted Fe-S protein YdhL (DUF1289 family)